MVARGDKAEQVAAQTGISVRHAEKLYLDYLALPLSQKLRLSQLPEAAIARSHRLADDIRDLERIDALLDKVEEKTLASLLDTKRKIKKRMAADIAETPAGAGNADMSSELEKEIDKYYKELVEEEKS